MKKADKVDCKELKVTISQITRKTWSLNFEMIPWKETESSRSLSGIDAGIGEATKIF